MSKFGLSAMCAGAEGGQSKATEKLEGKCRINLASGEDQDLASGAA